MKINDIITEKTEDPRSEVKRREQFRTGGGTHKDRKKAAKRGEAKHKKQDVPMEAEAAANITMGGSVLRGYKTWQVWIKNNYYNGKYADYSARPYTVIASSADEAKQVVLDNADYILKALMSKKLPNGRRVLPPRSALPITDQEIGRIEDGTVKGKVTTMGDKLSTYMSPQGPMKVKLDGGKIVDVEQGVAEGKEGKIDDIDEGKISDFVRRKNYERLTRRSQNKAIKAMMKPAEFDFHDLDNREKHEDEFMRQMAKRQERERRAKELGSDKFEEE